MKILFCGKCYGMHSFGLNSTDPEGEHPWTYCDCKQMAARWSQPNLGTVQVIALVPERTFIIGMNNRFLVAAALSAMAHSATDENWRKLHADATKSPGFVFDDNNRACWAAVLRVGETSDITWHPAQEKIKMGATVEEALYEPVKIKVNTREHVAERLFLSYDDIVTMAGHDPKKGVIYSITYHSKTKDGCLSPGKFVKAEPNLLISCMFTGNA